MSKHIPPPPPSEAANNVNLPIVTKGKRGNVLLLLKRFTEIADEIADDYGAMQRSAAKLSRWRYTNDRMPEYLDLPEDLDVELLSERLAEAKDMLAALESPELYERDADGGSNLRRDLVAQRLSLM